MNEVIRIKKSDQIKVILTKMQKYFPTLSEAEIIKILISEGYNAWEKKN